MRDPQLRTFPKDWPAEGVTQYRAVFCDPRRPFCMLYPAMAYVNFAASITAVQREARTENPRRRLEFDHGS